MPFDPFETRRIGATKVEVARLGLGTAPLGGWPEAVSREAGIATIRRAWDLGVRLFDTAPFYGLGQAEQFLGEALAVAEEVVTGGVKTSTIMVAPCEGQVNVRMIPVNVERRDPGPVREFLPREIQRGRLEAFGIGTRWHRKDHR